MDVILEGTVGSRAYGLSTPESDTDTLGVFIQPTEDLLGLIGPDLTKAVHADDDTTHHEVGKFLNLAFACNPTVIELLWLPANMYNIKTNDGAALVNHRKAYLTKAGVRNAYLGYTHSQVERVRREFANEARRYKATRHTLRLIESGTNLWRTGELKVKVQSSVELNARANYIVANQDWDMLDKILRQMRDVMDNEPTPIQESNDHARKYMDTWLRTTRIKNLGY